MTKSPMSAALMLMAPKWQQALAELWETIVKEYELAKAAYGPMRAAESVYKDHLNDSVPLDADGQQIKLLKLSPATIQRKFKDYVQGGRHASVFLPDYKPGKEHLPVDLENEFQRRLTLPGVRNVSVAIEWLKREWREGKALPGVGTWQQWWAKNKPKLPLPTTPPEFPFSVRSFYRRTPARSIRQLGNIGVAAFKCEAAHITRDYSLLRPGELYVLDDKRVDLLIIDDFTGEVTDVVIYVCMEVSSRRIVGFTARPARAMNARDVIGLIARVLGQEGYSSDYLTHILLERGTVAIPEKIAAKIERFSEGQIKIHRTGMDGGARAKGLAPDKASGHWMGKGVIESFMRKIDLFTMHLPGQRGNKHENMPMNLAYSFSKKTVTVPARNEGQDGEDVTVREIKGGEAAEAEMIARFEIMLGRKLGLKAPLLYLTEFNSIFRELMKDHNASRQHEYQDFSKVSQYWEEQSHQWKDSK